jgi:hypothetical protein
MLCAVAVGGSRACGQEVKSGDKWVWVTKSLVNRFPKPFVIDGDVIRMILLI